MWCRRRAQPHTDLNRCTSCCSWRTSLACWRRTVHLPCILLQRTAPLDTWAAGREHTFGFRFLPPQCIQMRSTPPPCTVRSLCTPALQAKIRIQCICSQCTVPWSNFEGRARTARRRMWNCPGSQSGRIRVGMSCMACKAPELQRSRCRCTASRRKSLCAQT